MFEPKNPLAPFATYQMRHILAAFKTTASAESTTLKEGDGKWGSSVGDGDGFIVSNEFDGDRFSIVNFVWEWRKGGYAGRATTSMDGYIDLADRTGGSFLDWFRTKIIQPLEISTGHMTFSLQTYFSGVNRNSGEHSSFTGNPFLFNVHSINETMNDDAAMGTNVRLFFTSCYNTSAQNPTLCKPYQITLTHAEGGLNNAAPIDADGSAGLPFRGAEDATNIPTRISRLELSKPMKTLKDVFDAFKNELNQQPEAHKKQVQEWLKSIRTDYVKKIEPDPKQERGEELPITFDIKLDEEYETYSIDNRNLPFEQPLENAEEDGVTSIPIKSGMTIIDIVEYLMKFSRQVGIDVDDKKTFKSNLSYERTTDKIKITLKIKQVKISSNYQDFGDNGEFNDGVNVELEFKSPETVDNDIIYLRTSLNSDNGIIPLEQGARLPVLGKREPITGERITPSSEGEEFFKSEFSGLRVPIGLYRNTELEDAQSAAKFDIGVLIENDQQSNHEIQIRGNPLLMYDFYRLPSEAKELNNPGSYTYYKLPETDPLYLKIKIYLKKDAVIGLERFDDPANVFYYKNYYEVVSVLNNMTHGGFYQNIELKKSDDLI